MAETIEQTGHGHINPDSEIIHNCEKDVNIIDALFSSMSLSPHTTENEEIPENTEKIMHQYNLAPTKKWIKLIPLEKTIPFEIYNRKDYFIHVADIVLDDEIYTNGQKQGMKKRNTSIQFVHKISSAEFSKKVEWIYIITINECIVKIGGTRTGLKGRTSSYLCGHHIQERGKSGDCSKTNAYIYNTLEFYLQQGYTVKMYGYQLPKTEFTIKILDNDVNIIAQTFHAYETTFMEDYNKNYGDYPFLCDNCDPDYKNDAEC